MSAAPRRSLPTQKEIARLAGVSQVTVNAVLNDSNHTRTRPETRERILSIARSLNYRVQRHARLMKTGKSGSIALVCAAQVLETVYLRLNLSAAAVREAGFFPKIYDINWTGGNLVETWGEMAQDQPEGVLLLGGLALMTPEVRAAILALEVPIVSLSGPKLEGIPLLIPDYKEGFRNLTHHLARGGRRRIALVMRKASTYQKAYRWQDERRPGYLQAMEELGLEPNIHDREIRYSERSADMLATLTSERRVDHCHYGYAFAREALDQGPLKDEGWVFFNDALAIGALRALGEAGVRVPEALAVTGSDGETHTRYGYLPLTTLVQPLRAIVSEGVSLLAEMIREREPRRDLVRRLPCQLYQGATG